MGPWAGAGGWEGGGFDSGAGAKFLSQQCPYRSMDLQVYITQGYAAYYIVSVSLHGLCKNILHWRHC